MDSSKFSKFLLTNANKDGLRKFPDKLKRMSKHMESEMGICIYDAIECSIVSAKLEKLFLLMLCLQDFI